MFVGRNFSEPKFPLQACVYCNVVFLSVCLAVVALNVRSVFGLMSTLCGRFRSTHHSALRFSNAATTLRTKTDQLAWG